MRAPKEAPRWTSYTAELRFELQASWIDPEEIPPLDYLVHRDEWAAASGRRGIAQLDVDLCLWFDWCLTASMWPAALGGGIP